MIENNTIKVAVISPEKSAYSATFIQAHIDLLDAEVTHLHGIFFPVASDDGQYTLKENSWIKRVFDKLKLSRIYKKLFRNPQLVRYLKEKKIALVLAEFGMVGAEVTDVCKTLNIPLIVHFHGNDAYIYSIWEKYEKCFKSLFIYAQYIIVVSHDMHQKLKKEGAFEDKLTLNPYGPRKDFLTLHPNFKYLTFVVVGRFVEKKAPQLTLRAFKKVQNQFPEARLIMAGDGPLLPFCQQWAVESGLEASVVFHGVATHDEVKRLFSEAYCFVQHSVVAANGDSEGTPVAILEASAAGLPVVATRHAGIQDVVIHGETGFLVEEHDVDGMAQYMITLALNEAQAEQMGKKGRQRIIEHFTMDKHITTINRLIKNSLYAF